MKIHNTKHHIHIDHKIPKQKTKELVAQAEKWVDKSTFKHQIKEYGHHTLEKTIKSCEKIWKLNSELGLKEHQLYKMALYINTELKTKISEGTCYLRKKETHLARTIEHDPKSKNTFIHLNIPLGSGVHKVVTKSLMYDAKKPKFVATATSTEDCAQEVKTHKKFRNMKGLVHTYAVTHHTKETSKKKVTSMMLEYHNAQSMRHYQYSRGELTTKEELTIARDILYGLENMHKKGFVHRDLHSGNFLVNRDAETKEVSAVIIDHGRAKTTKEAAANPTITPAKRLNPPEIFRKSKSLDHKALDIYALGCELHHLHFGKQPDLPSKDDFTKAVKGDRKKKKAFAHELSAKVKEFRAKIKSDVEQKEKENKATVSDLFGKVIAQMCNCNPKARGSAHDLRVKVDELLKQA